MLHFHTSGVTWQSTCILYVSPAVQISFMCRGTHQEGSLLLAVLNRDRLVRVLTHMLDENEFLSPYGIRSLSKVCRAPRSFPIDKPEWSFHIPAYTSLT